MSKRYFKQPTAVLLVSLLSGCVPSFWSQQGAAPVASGGMPVVSQEGGIKVIREGDRTTLVRQDVVLKGRVMLDDGDRQTQAAVSDVVSNATVAIIDPTLNLTVSTSTTDGAGNFQIPLPVTWSPVAGNTYIVEAVKGLGNGAAGQRALRLRTVIQKLAGATPFASISGSASIAISPMTTAVYLRSAAGFGSAGIGGTALPLAATGVFGATYNGTVNPSTGALKAANQFQATWSVTDTQLTNLSQMISDSVAGNVDPLAQASNPLPPAITAMSATTGPVGSVLLITGTGFSPVTGAATVSFNGTTGIVMYQSGNNIVAGVPSGATTGAVTVTTRIGTSAGSTFTVSSPAGSATNAPILTSISKRSANVGDTIQIGGSNFASGAGNTVTFPSTNGGTVNATATYVSANQIAVAVPATAKSGPFQVTTANGVSNGYYLDVWHSSGTITEDFSTATNYDSAPSNIQWLGGASSAGDNLSGGTIQTITDWDAINPDTVNTELQNAQDLNSTYPSTIQLAYTEGSYPIGNNGYIPAEEGQDSGGIYPNGLATNGYQILGMNNNYLLYFPGHGIGNQSAWFRNNQPNMALTLTGPWTQNGTGGSGNQLWYTYKLAGLAGCPSWFYQDETVPSLSSISWVDFTNFMSPVQGNCPLYSTDNATPLLINKIAAGSINNSIYGTKMGSDGTYIYLLSGTGVVNGATVYPAAVNLYRFRPDNYVNPTRLTLVKILQNIAGPATYAFNQYSQFIVDRRGFYYPGYNASGTTDSYALYSLRTGLSRAINVGFSRRNGNYYCGCWDSVNDEYYGGLYNGNSNYRDRFLYPNYVASGSVTTGAYNLPVGTQWHSLTLVTDPIPAGATVSVNVLTGAGGAIAGYGTLNNVTSISLQGANAKSQGSLKIKLTLSAPNTANGYVVTPVVRALILKTRPAAPVAQSKAIQFGSAGPNDTVVVDSVSLIQGTYGGTVGLAYATSSDNSNWSSFGSLFTSVNQAYMKFQVLPTESTDPTTSFSPPILRKIVLNYHY